MASIANASAEIDERALVRRIRAGEVTAFEVLFHTYYEVLCAFAEGLTHSPPAAEDLVHDVFLQIWTTRAQWEVRDDVRSYLYRAVRNRALNVIKHGRVAARWYAEAMVDGGSVAGVGSAPAHADVMTRTKELSTAFERALAALPERQREAFLLRWQHQLSYGEIATVMGISEKTVESTLTRTLKKLRHALRAFL